MASTPPQKKKLKVNPQTEFANFVLSYYRMKLLIFLRESAQNCIISHKISHKFSVDVAQSPPQTLPILHLLCCASTPRLRRSLDAFGILVSAPRWLKPPPPPVKILAMSLSPGIGLYMVRQIDCVY